MKPALLLLFASSVCVFAQPNAPKEKPKSDDSEKSDAKETREPVVKEDAVTIDGKKIPYKVTTGKLELKKNNGDPSAHIFHVSYERTDISDTSNRPVIFAFNGGPGSSAVWLHIGAFGPRKVEFPGDGTMPPVPPARILENPNSLLDIADLVFIDPVTTGYSEAAKDVNASEFHGVDGDVRSVGDFIRRWVTEHERWDSPKFLLGESYGGIRAAGLSNHLQSRYGMTLNGVIMLSTLLDYRTLQSSQGNNLSYEVFLPSFTGVAHHFKKITGDRDALVAECRDFAFGPYAAALAKGTSIPDDEASKVADQLAKFTGLSSEFWLEHDLRVNASLFRTELLRKEGKVIGRFDARVAWDVADSTAPYPRGDVSYSVAYGPFATAMLKYLGKDLGWKEDQPYEILTSQVHPWNWNASNGYVNQSDELSGALKENPYLRVLVMGGYTDLATPPTGMEYSIQQMMDLPESLRGQISYTHYDGGHMFYLNPSDLVKARKDIVSFIEADPS